MITWSTVWYIFSISLHVVLVVTLLPLCVILCCAVMMCLQERVLLEQPYLLDQNKTVAEAVKEAVASCGENVQVRRFVRFTLGEGIEKKESNLAADVAAATGGKA